MRLFGMFFFCFCLITSIFAAPRPSLNSSAQVSFGLISTPVPMVADHQSFLVYEILLTNVGHKKLKLKQVSVLANENSIPIAEFSEKDLIQLIQHDNDNKNDTDKDEDNMLFKSGSFRILYMWLPFKNVKEIPTTISHNIQFETIDSPIEKLNIKSEPISLAKTATLVVGAPLKGGRWVAEYGPSNTSSHRRAYLVNDGKIYLAQRYAIDFAKVGKDDKTFLGDQNKNESYHAYGENIYAVADGRVIAMRNDIPENIPGNTRAVKITEATVAGNYIVLEIGYHLYAFYAHMQPGTVRVKIGELVKKGDIIGKVGNTGNSTDPHLHFHIINEPNFIFANGLPYAFENFTIQHAKLSADETTITFKDKLLKPMKNELLLQNDLVNFAT